MLAAQDVGDFRGHPAENLPSASTTYHVWSAESFVSIFVVFIAQTFPRNQRIISNRICRAQSRGNGCARITPRHAEGGHAWNFRRQMIPETMRPTPAGVPVRMTSPVSSVKRPDM